MKKTETRKHTNSWIVLCTFSSFAVLALSNMAHSTRAEESDRPRPLFHAPLDGDLRVKSEGEAEGKLAKGARFVQGRFGKAILAGNDQKYAAELRQSGMLNREEGTLMFWFQPQRRFEKEKLRSILIAPVNMPGPSLQISSNKSEARLWISNPWAERRRRGVSAVYNHLKAKKWYHAAITWHAQKEDLCLWLFGSAQADTGVYGMEGVSDAPLTDALRFGGPDVAVDDIRIYDRALTGQEIRKVAGVEELDCLSDEGLRVYDAELLVEGIRGQLLFEESFDSDWRKSWVLEGPGNLRHEDGQLYMESKRPKEGGHIVLWNKRDFPSNFVAEWEFTPAKLTGLCIVFFCAKGRNGEDILDPSLPPRDGVFKNYHSGAINCYHISYYRNTCRRAPIVALRKNFGFYRIASGRDYIPLEAGRKDHLTLVKRGAHIQFATNGRLSIDWIDDGESYGPVLGAGKVGLRQMAHTYGYYDDFRVYALREE